MATHQQTLAAFKAVRGIRRIALSAIASGFDVVTIPIQKSRIPTGPEIHIADQCGPRGFWKSISGGGGEFVIMAEFKPLVVLVWCDKVLKQEKAAV